MTNTRLDTLLKKQESINARIAAVKAAANAQARKDDTRLKIIVGAAILTDTGLHPENRSSVVAVLNRAVKTDRDRDFLKSKGLL